MFVKGIFKDVQSQSLVQVLEEDLSHVVTFADDNGIFRTQLIQIGKSWTEHRVGRNIAESALFIKLLQSSLNGSNVADDAIFWKYGQYLVERIQSVLHRCGIDHQLRLEFFDFFQIRETIAVVHESQFVWIHIKHRCFMLETQYIGKKGAHFTSS